MRENTTSKLWIIAAIGFMISGILGRNSVFIILGCAFTVFGCQNMKSKNENNDKKNDKVIK